MTISANIARRRWGETQLQGADPQMLLCAPQVREGIPISLAVAENRVGCVTLVAPAQLSQKVKFTHDCQGLFPR